MAEAFQDELILVIFYFSTVIQKVDLETSIAYINLPGNISLVFLDISHIIHGRSRNDRKFVSQTIIRTHSIDLLIFSRINSQECTSLEFFVRRYGVCYVCLRICHCQIGTGRNRMYLAITHIFRNRCFYLKRLELIRFSNHIRFIFLDICK